MQIEGGWMKGLVVDGGVVLVCMYVGIRTQWLGFWAILCHGYFCQISSDSSRLSLCPSSVSVYSPPLPLWSLNKASGIKIKLVVGVCAEDIDCESSRNISKNNPKVTGSWFTCIAMQYREICVDQVILYKRSNDAVISDPVYGNNISGTMFQPELD